MSSTVFDPAAEAYDRLRPAYPRGLYSGIQKLADRPFRGAAVVDVGAGTGIATQALASRGARVLAVDLSLAMLRQQRVPSAAVVGSGTALPVRNRVIDLVCYAMSWHWLPEEAATAEAVRVLRPGGALAVWWHQQQNDEKSVDPRRWYDERGLPRPPSSYPIDHDDVERRLRQSGRFADVRRLAVRWERRADIDEVLAEKATHSSVIQLGDKRQDFVQHYRAQLEAAWPDGIVREHYLCQLHVALVA